MSRCACAESKQNPACDAFKLRGEVGMCGNKAKPKKRKKSNKKEQEHRVSGSSSDGSQATAAAVHRGAADAIPPQQAEAHLAAANQSSLITSCSTCNDTSAIITNDPRHTQLNTKKHQLQPKTVISLTTVVLTCASAVYRPSHYI